MPHHHKVKNSRFYRVDNAHPYTPKRPYLIPYRAIHEWHIQTISNHESVELA